MRSTQPTVSIMRWAVTSAAILVLIVSTILLNGTSVYAQTFSSGSDGSDGALIVTGTPGTVVVFDPKQFSGSQVSANIFNFTTINIASGVTLKVTGDKVNGPLIWLAQGDVDVSGAIDLSGGAGYDFTSNVFSRVPSTPGPGGYAGGPGGDETQAALPGGGPGGGAAGVLNVSGRAGTFSGNSFLIPLVGGSGGGGGLRARPSDPLFGPGGGAGGGAILIASSAQLTVTGLIKASGGRNGSNFGACCASEVGGSGSGGAIRLVANAIGGNGVLDVSGGIGNDGGPTGSNGRIRLEATTITFNGGMTNGASAQSVPFPLLLPTAGTPSAKVISIGGAAINANPNVFPDVTINSASPVDVVIQTKNIPTSATINLTILNENGVADLVIQAPPLAGCDQNNVCTTTVPVVFPFGASRGLTKVTWMQ